jgi:CcmD family protein
MTGDLGQLAIALLAVWAGIGAYLLSLHRRQSALERRLDELESRSRSKE